MIAALPGGKSITANRVPFGGGGVPTMRAPMSSGFSPIEMSAGIRSVHQISVETIPAARCLAVVARPSCTTLATVPSSCPVTMPPIRGAPRIRLGTSVVNLPYHHPFHVAERIAFLDHLTQGRAILGIGPSNLVSDKRLFAIPQEKLYPMMAESTDVIVRLLESPEPFSHR